MQAEQEILDSLDATKKQGPYYSFIELGHGYSYLIDSRLTIFRNDAGKWAIAAERLGYNPRAGNIVLEIIYFGNCLFNLEPCNDQFSNIYHLYPISYESFETAIENETIKPGQQQWIVRGTTIELSHNKQDYSNAGIELKEYEAGEISAEEAGRLVITTHRDLFRATDEELYKSIPADLDKILVLDEWYHRDFMEMILPDVAIDEQQVRAIFEASKDSLAAIGYVEYENLGALIQQSATSRQGFNQQQWEENRPGAYETWQQLAKVISTGDISHYKPTLEANTHWKYWPDSGSL
jgi:hypothetical protein